MPFFFFFLKFTAKISLRIDSWEEERQPAGRVPMDWRRETQCQSGDGDEGTAGEPWKMETGHRLVTDWAENQKDVRIRGSESQQVSSGAAGGWYGHPLGGGAQKQPHRFEGSC